MRSGPVSMAFGLMLLSLQLLPGCATRGSVRRLDAETKALAARVVDLRASEERASRETARVLTDVTTLDARLIELGSALKMVSADIARLHGRINALDEALRATRAAAEQPRSAPPAEPGDRARREPAVTDGPERAYAAALAMFQRREHGQAVLDFLEFITTHPTHPLASSAQFWIAEAYFAQRDYRQALVEFQKVLGYAPPSPKAAESLLKIGLCHQNLRDPVRAGAAWRAVVRGYAGSDAAARARALLGAGGPRAAR